MKNSGGIGDTLRTVAISANLSALRTLLANAAEVSGEAHAFTLRGERNAAIGTLIGLAAVLDDAKSLYAAAMALHSSKGL